MRDGLKGSHGTKSRLLEAGRLLISRQGFDSMGINALLQTAEVSRGSFYHHFESKEAFGLALLRECFERCFAGLDEVPEAARAHCFSQWLGDLLAQRQADLRLIAQLSAEHQTLPPCLQAELVCCNEQSLARLAGCFRGQSDDCAALKQRITTLYGLWLGLALLGECQGNIDSVQACLRATDLLLGDAAQAFG